MGRGNWSSYGVSKMATSNAFDFAGWESITFIVGEGKLKENRI